MGLSGFGRKEGCCSLPATVTHGVDEQVVLGPDLLLDRNSAELRADGICSHSCVSICDPWCCWSCVWLIPHMTACLILMNVIYLLVLFLPSLLVHFRVCIIFLCQE